MRHLIAALVVALLGYTGPAGASELQDEYAAYQEAAQRGDLHAALPHAQRAYELGLEQFGPIDRNTGLLAFNLGFIENDLLEYQAAASVLSDGLYALEHSEHVQDRELFDTLTELGRAQLGQYDSVSAYQTLDRALAMAQSAYGSMSVQAGQVHYLLSFTPLFYETEGQPSVFRIQGIHLNRSAMETMDELWAPVGSNIHRRPRWSRSLDFEVNQFVEIGEEHLNAAIAIFEAVEGNDALLAGARLLQAAYGFRDGGRRQVDRMYQQAIDGLIDARFSDNFLIRLVIPWMNERHSSGWSISRVADNIRRVADLAYLRPEGEPFGLAQLPPRYPADALRRREEGSVCMRFEINEQGRPNAMEVYSEDHPRSLESAAIEAVEQFIYAPRMRGGSPVATDDVSFCFDFTLEAD